MPRLFLALLLGLGLLLGAGQALAQDAPAPAATPTPDAGIPRIHRVQEGETLFGIAQQYGTTVERLQAANSLLDPGLITVGQELIIPGASGDPFATSAIVRLGDNLASLAAAYNTTPDAIAAANHLLHPAALVVGESLLVTSRTGSPNPSPPTGAPHVVQPGEGLLAIAARYRLAPTAVATLNDLTYPYRVYPGQRLRLPGDAPFQSLVGEWARVSLGPLPAAQGHAMSLYVESLLAGEPRGSFRGRSIRFAPAGPGFVALIGLDAFAETGVTMLELDGGGDRPWTPLRQAVAVERWDYGRQDLILPEDRSDLLDPALVAAEIAFLEEVYTQFTPAQQWTGLFLAPVLTNSVVSAGYGSARSYNGGPYSSFHSGTDYAAFVGTTVTAPAAGTVVLSQTLTVRGNTLIIDHGLGVMTGYYHLSKILVGPGETVAPGQPVAEVGNTGLSTGPHLHWDLRLMNVPIDPLEWTVREFPLVP